jgi:Spy/CpxP family protein refolding chaperone
MTKSKLITVLAFLVVFLAGASVGMVRRHAETLPQESHDPLRDLNLTAPQRDQMRQIWDDVTKRRPPREAYEKIDHERDAKIAALLSGEQKAQYDQIRRDHDAQRDALHKQWEALLHEADERMKTILTPAQQQKFDEIRKQHGHRPPFRGGRRGAETHAAT